MFYLEARVHSLSSFVSTALQLSDNFSWPQNVYCTNNFAQTLHGKNLANVGTYLRLVDSYLYFHKSKDILLLSERETHCIIELFWQNSSMKLNVSLLHYPFQKNWNTHTWPNDALDCNHLLSIPPMSRFKEIDIIVALKMFSAETTFNSTEVKELRHLLVCNSNRGAKVVTTPAINRLIDSRGHNLMLPYSDLERVYNEILAEMYIKNRS